MTTIIPSCIGRNYYQSQRHWLLWQAHFTLDKLFCARELYDPAAIHFTLPKMIDKTGKDIDIQATIEEPQLCILGQSRSMVDDQMKFVPTRQEDLRGLY